MQVSLCVKISYFNIADLPTIGSTASSPFSTAMKMASWEAFLKRLTRVPALTIRLPAMGSFPARLEMALLA